MLDFLKEGYSRFTTVGVPKFFRVLQVIGLFAAALGGFIQLNPFTGHLSVLNEWKPDLIEGGLLIAFVLQFVQKEQAITVTQTNTTETKETIVKIPTGEKAE